MTLKNRKVKKIVNRTGRELPEDILADSSVHLFKEISPPFYKRKRFNFLIGATIGLLAMYAASTTPVAQTHFTTLQDYVLLQLADLDLPNLLPASDMMDDFLGNFTSFLRPTTPISEISFMPAIEYK